MKNIFLTTAILLLAMFGGVQFYMHPVVLHIWVLLGLAAMGWAGWLLLRGAVMPYAPGMLWLTVAVCISVAGNWDIYPTTLSRVWLYGVAVAVLVISRRYLDTESLWQSIYRAGWLWPACWVFLSWVLGWWGNDNVVAFWPVLFIVVGLSGKHWLYILPHVIILFYLGSRGAMVAAGVAMFIYLWPSLRRARYVVVLCLPLVLWGMIAYRFNTAEYRLYFWFVAWGAIQDNWLFGVGPGGIKIRQIITEPGSNLYQIHAHNSLISWAAETGMVGMLCLAAAVYTLRAKHYVLSTWQLTMFAAVITHSMVDEPLWWPGPLLIISVIIATTPPKNW